MLPHVQHPPSDPKGGHDSNDDVDTLFPFADVEPQGVAPPAAPTAVAVRVVGSSSSPDVPPARRSAAPAPAPASDSVDGNISGQDPLHGMGTRPPARVAHEMKKALADDAKKAWGQGTLDQHGTQRVTGFDYITEQQRRASLRPGPQPATASTHADVSGTAAGAALTARAAGSDAAVTGAAGARGSASSGGS